MNRKQIGAYYTPIKVAQPLADWAIRTGTERVIDPTFGGCSFIQSAINRGRKLGNKDFSDNIYGCDLDPTAFEHLRKVIGRYNKKNFNFCDFLEFKTELKYDSIIGNPPYIKHDNIPELALAKARATIAGFEELYHLVKPNYWVYFTVHCLSILKQGGRMALILPLSFMNSQYSKILREFLILHFSRIDVFPISEKVFEGTEENTLIALFESYSQNKKRGRLIFYDPISISEIGKYIPNKKYYEISKQSKNSTSEISKLIEASLKFGNISSLDNLFEIKIGIVTGAKEYFIKTEEEFRKKGISRKFIIPVISRADSIKHLIINKDQLEELPFLLVIPENYIVGTDNSDPAIDKYILSASKDILETYHSRHRKPWYSLRNIYSAKYYLKNVNSNHAFLYQNDSEALVTNNMLRLIPRKGMDISISSVVSLSSLFQLSSFSSGIRYGKKALKLDPQHAKKIVIPHSFIIEESETARSLELHAKYGFDRASAYIDEIISERIFKDNGDILRECKAALQYLLKRDFQ